jgi:hypothetical protein
MKGQRPGSSGALALFDLHAGFPESGTVEGMILPSATGPGWISAGKSARQETLERVGGEADAVRILLVVIDVDEHERRPVRRQQESIVRGRNYSQSFRSRENWRQQ